MHFVFMVNIVLELKCSYANGRTKAQSEFTRVVSKCMDTHYNQNVACKKKVMRIVMFIFADECMSQKWLCIVPLFSVILW